jgi:hypothetical protein
MEEKMIGQQPEENKKVTIKEFLTIKLLSGRFLLTIAGSLAFIIITITFCRLLLAKQETLTIPDIIPILSTLMLIISNIFTFYFFKESMRQTSTSSTANERETSGD